MKVLITGGYGFIGSHVADRLNKEGHQVFILDNLSTGRTNNVKFKHNGYILDIENKKCEEVFKTNKFDIVIHLAAHTDALGSIDNPAKDTKVNLMGLTNMLSLSTKYKIKKFIFASSCTVYGNSNELPIIEESCTDPLTPYGMSKLTGEMYCQKWRELYGLNTICLRLSSVYGPRQRSEGEGGVVASFIKKNIKQQEIAILGDGTHTRDFIYVEDVADAIYRCINADVSGIYNVSSGTQTSINSLIDIIGQQQSIKSKVHKETKSQVVYHICLNNSKFKKCTDWVPLYDLNEGINKTISWFVSNFQSKKTQRVKKSKSEKNIRTAIIPYIENLIGFFILLALSIFFKENFSNNISTYLLFYIVLMGVVYGTKQSIPAIILSSGIFIHSKLSTGGEVLAFIYDTQSILQLALFILLGLGVGYTVDKKELKYEGKNHEHELLLDNYNFLKEIHDETTMAKEQLQSQISSSEDSFGKVFSMTNQLDSLEPEKIFYSAINIVESVMKSNKVALYLINKTGDYLRLSAKSAQKDFTIPKSIKVENCSEFREVLETGNTFINRYFKSDTPIMMTPIFNGEKVVAIIGLYNVEFDNITLHYKNLFNVVTGLISSAINKAYAYNELVMDTKYLSGSSVLKGEYFKELIETKSMARNRFNIDFCLAEIINYDNFRLQELSHIINNTIRESDHIGMIEGVPYVMLANSSLEEAKNVMNRLKNMGIECSIKNSEVCYA